MTAIQAGPQREDLTSRGLEKEVGGCAPLGERRQGWPRPRIPTHEQGEEEQRGHGGRSERPAPGAPPSACQRTGTDLSEGGPLAIVLFAQRCEPLAEIVVFAPHEAAPAKSARRRSLPR